MLLKELRCNSLDDMLSKVGSGAITVHHLERALLPEEFRREDEKRRQAELLEKTASAEQNRAVSSGREAIDIDGVDGMLVKVSQCCKPVPGDEIIGFITTGSGISIHKVDCPNLRTTDPQRWIEVSWSGSVQSRHRTELFLRAENKKNLLTEISTIISSDDIEKSTMISDDNTIRSLK